MADAFYSWKIEGEKQLSRRLLLILTNQERLKSGDSGKQRQIKKDI